MDDALDIGQKQFHVPQKLREHLDTPTGPERGLSSPQQRRTAGGLQALTGTVRSPRVAADWKVRAPVGVSRCAFIRNFEHLA